jgi:hypothetical protein
MHSQTELNIWCNISTWPRQRTFNPSLTPTPPLSHFLHTAVNGHTPHDFLTSEYCFTVLFCIQYSTTLIIHITPTLTISYYRFHTQYTERHHTLTSTAEATQPHKSRWKLHTHILIVVPSIFAYSINQHDHTYISSCFMEELLNWGFWEIQINKWINK